MDIYENAGELLFLVVIIFAVLFLCRSAANFEPPERRAGRHGEEYARKIIAGVLNEKDILLSNVVIYAAGKETELDNIVVNNRGVFIIEVKNYTGELSGDEDDFEWIKTKVTDAGNVYQKNVKNPIKQVKRQIYILAEYLKEYGFDVWVEGYAILLDGNAPVESRHLLKSVSDVEKALHAGKNNRLTVETKNRIVELLSYAA